MFCLTKSVSAKVSNVHGYVVVCDGKAVEIYAPLENGTRCKVLATTVIECEEKDGVFAAVGLSMKQGSTYNIYIINRTGLHTLDAMFSGLRLTKTSLTAVGGSGIQIYNIVAVPVISALLFGAPGKITGTDRFIVASGVPCLHDVVLRKTWMLESKCANDLSFHLASGDTVMLRYAICDGPLGRPSGYSYVEINLLAEPVRL